MDSEAEDIDSDEENDIDKIRSVKTYKDVPVIDIMKDKVGAVLKTYT